MARNRRPGEVLPPPTRGPSQTTLSVLLRARRFRIAAGAERVAANLIAAGAQLSPDAPAWIGAGAPPPEAPALALGEAAGTLGPHSYGFLNLSQPGVGQVVALDMPRPTALPRPGRLGVVVSRRDELPDLLPLLCARDLHLSWLISVGDGDPSEVIAFLSDDDATDALAISLGAGARPAGLRSTLGAKPTVVLGGDAIARAVARRAGAHVVDRLGEWLALCALHGSGANPEAEAEVWVMGGGQAWVRDEVRRYELEAQVRALDERDPQALAAALAAVSGPRTVIVVGAELTLPPIEDESVVLIAADTRQPEQVSRLLKAMALERARSSALSAATAEAAPAPVDAALAARVRAETEGPLTDHDAKRLLKAWGLKVTRQAPTGTPTGAVKLAQTIGLPLVLLRGDDERVAETIPEVRRVAALLLELEAATPRSVMVRERFPEAPRARVRVVAERGVGLAMRIGEAVALLPLDGAEALRLAQHSGARRAADQRSVAALLGQLSAAALAESATLDLELYVGAEPTVLRATGAIKRPPG